MATESGQAKALANQQVNSWAAALTKLPEWDPAWAECVQMTTQVSLAGSVDIQ